MTSQLRKSSRTPSMKQNHQHQSVVIKTPKKQEIQFLDETSYPRTGQRGAPQVFPRKLFQILNECDPEVIGWTNQHGTSFTIYDMDEFSENVLLNYFRHQKYSSFQRQLNLYGFHKISKGPETGAYAHDCFIRDKPQLLMGVRRLPQRTPSSASKSHGSSKGKFKIVIKKKDIAKNTEKHGAFSKLTSCMRPRRAHHDSQTDETNSDCDDDESESSDESDHEVEVPPKPPSFRDVSGESVDSISYEDESNSLDFFDLQTQDEYTLLESFNDDDQTVCVQPLPKECIIDPSAKVVDGISKGVTQLAIAKSPIAVAKTVKNVIQPMKLPESSKVWAVKQSNYSKPLSPTNSTTLQKMIPRLVRAGSSTMSIGKDLKFVVDDDMKSMIEDLQYMDTVNRSKSMSVDNPKDLMLPSPLDQRLSSEAWTLDSSQLVSEQEIQQVFSNGQLDHMFSRQESFLDIIPPKVVEMER